MYRFHLAFAIAMMVITVPGIAAPVAAGKQVPFKGSL